MTPGLIFVSCCSLALGCIALAYAAVFAGFFLWMIFTGDDEGAISPFGCSATFGIIGYCFLAISSLAWNLEITPEWFLIYTVIIAVSGLAGMLALSQLKEGTNEG